MEEEFLGVPYSSVPLPQSFIEWDGYHLEEILEDLWEGGSQWFHDNMTWIQSVQELFEYFIEIIPKDIWSDFSMYLAKVVDYHFENEGGISLQLPRFYK